MSALTNSSHRSRLLEDDDFIEEVHANLEMLAPYVRDPRCLSTGWRNAQGQRILCAIDPHVLMLIVMCSTLLYFRSGDFVDKLNGIAVGQLLDRVCRRNVAQDPRPFISEMLKIISVGNKEKWGSREKLHKEIVDRLRINDDGNPDVEDDAFGDRANDYLKQITQARPERLRRAPRVVKFTWYHAAVIMSQIVSA